MAIASVFGAEFVTGWVVCMVGYHWIVDQWRMVRPSSEGVLTWAFLGGPIFGLVLGSIQAAPLMVRHAPLRAVGKVLARSVLILITIIALTWTGVLV